eukprot:6492154-Alexandrium_andersonii.AAC.1
MDRRGRGASRACTRSARLSSICCRGRIPGLARGVWRCLRDALACRLAPEGVEGLRVRIQGGGATLQGLGAPG